MENKSRWESGLQSLRARFEVGPSNHSGVRCYLCRENSTGQNSHFTKGSLNRLPPSDILFPLIGEQASGVTSLHTTWLTDQEDTIHWWLCHEALYEAERIAKWVPGSGPEVFQAAKHAQECERAFVELADEASSFLREVQLGCSQSLDLLLAKPKLKYDHALWITTLFSSAHQQSSNSNLNLAYSFPRQLGEIDQAIIDDIEVPENVLLKLECNPFAGSVFFIDTLLIESQKDKVLKPKWNAEAMELSYKGTVIRKYPEQASNCKTVLNVFQEMDWPTRIDDPCRGGKNPQRVYKTVDSLNKNQETITFSAANGGTAFTWKAVNPTNTG